MKIFRKIWAIYGFVIFAITILFFAPALIIFNIIGGQPLDWFIRKSYYYIPRILFHPCFITFESQGTEKIDREKNYILISNHKSYLDIFANAATSPFPFKYLAKDEIRHIPMVGWVASNFCVFVNRSEKKSRSQVIIQMQRALDAGHSILIYPEGTRNKSGEKLSTFYDGAFKLAVASQTPIAIQTLVNTDKLNSPQTVIDLFPGKVISKWSDPIDTKGLSDKDIPELKARVRKIMLDNLS